MIELKKKTSGMGSLTRTGIVLLTLACFIDLSSCGGDDEEAAPSNQIKLDGQTIKFDEADLGSILNIEDELGNYSYHEFFLTSEGLTMSETGSLSGSGDMVVFGLISESSTELKEGTYELKLNTEIGDVDYFEVYSNLTESGMDTYYAAYRGTIKVSKSGDNYTLTFDIDVFTSQTETSQEEFVDGSIIGNYKGTVDVITGGGSAKLPAARTTKGKRTFTWL